MLEKIDENCQESSTSQRHENQENQAARKVNKSFYSFHRSRLQLIIRVINFPTDE